MNVLIAGGTGFIGSHLANSLTADQHQVTILTRKKRPSNNPYLSYLEWNGKEMPMAIGFYDVVINFSGASIAEGRWTDSRKALLLSSRVDTTKACVNYINRSVRPPQLFISTSAVGIYGGDNPQEVDEDSPEGDDYMAELCKEWEAAAQGANCRTVIGRVGIVLGREAGFFYELKKIYKMWLGGRMGDGKQGISWIHIRDIVGALRFIIDQPEVEGPVNLVAPNWANQVTFSNDFAVALHVMDLFIVPKFGLKMLFGEQSVIFWGGQKVVPSRLEKYGYQFHFSNHQDALEDLAE